MRHAAASLRLARTVTSWLTGLRGAARGFGYRLDDALDRGLERLAERVAAARLGQVQLCREHLLGRACHCPPGLRRHFVHSEGLREGCDLVVDFGSNVEHPRRQQIPLPLLQGLGDWVRPGDSIHVKADLLPWFVNVGLQRIKAPFVLVTGDSDVGLVQRYAGILESSTVSHWFAQNCDVPYRHPKLTRLPIGLDNPIYTKLIKRLGFALHVALRKAPWDPTLSRNDMGDQALLQRIAAARCIAVADKPARVLCTFQHNSKLSPNAMAIPARASAMEHLLGNASCWFPPGRLRQVDYWAAHSAFAFEAAPRGNGLDCFRVWECLILGTIPIVQRSTLDPLFEDESFPVALVDDYDEVTPKRLDAWQRELQGRFDDGLLTRLTNDYWLAKIAQAKAAAASQA